MRKKSVYKHSKADFTCNNLIRCDMKTCLIGYNLKVGSLGTQVLGHIKVIVHSDCNVHGQLHGQLHRVVQISNMRNP